MHALVFHNLLTLFLLLYSYAILSSADADDHHVVVVVVVVVEVVGTVAEVAAVPGIVVVGVVEAGLFTKNK